MVNDISRALFNAKAEREVYVQLAQEDMRPGDETTCGKLRYSMYETRDAAQIWYRECSGRLKEMGFAQGNASPYVFVTTNQEAHAYTCTATITSAPASHTTYCG